MQSTAPTGSCSNRIQETFAAALASFEEEQATSNPGTFRIIFRFYTFPDPVCVSTFSKLDDLADAIDHDPYVKYKWAYSIS